MASTDIKATLSLDTTEAEAKIAAMMKQVKELRTQMRPWWCPRWLFNLVSDNG